MAFIAEPLSGEQPSTLSLATPTHQSHPFTHLLFDFSYRVPISFSDSKSTHCSRRSKKSTVIDQSKRGDYNKATQAKKPSFGPMSVIKNLSKAAARNSGMSHNFAGATSSKRGKRTRLIVQCFVLWVFIGQIAFHKEI